MNISILAALFYFVAYVGAVSGIYKIKKSNKKLYGITWGAVSIVGMNCFQVFVAAILNLIHIPVNCVSIGVFELAVGVVCWYEIIKKKQVQSHCYDWSDALFTVVLLGVVVLFSYQRYGLDLSIHYLTIDPAEHLKMAMNVVTNQNVDRMFYGALTNAMLIEFLGAFKNPAQYYQIFVLGDILNLLLAGWMFFGVIRRFCKDNFLKLGSIVITIIYLLAYPLNNTIFGFVYLGMGVTIIAYLIIVVDEFMRGNLNKWINIVLISAGCLGIFECYVLFMPVTFFAILTCVLVKQYQAKKLFSVDTVITGLSIFLVPCIIGLLYTYMGFFGSEGGQTVGSAIVSEGGIYRDLYSNFLFVMPFALLGFWNLVKEKKNRLLLFLIPFLGVFVLSLFIRGMKGTVSSYYYYKNYYLLWLLVFILAFQGISSIAGKARVLIVCFLGIWIFNAGIFATRIETRIQNKNSLFCVNQKAGAYLDIYSFNRDAKALPPYPWEKVQLYQYAVTELLEKDEVKPVPIAGYWEDAYWMEAITNQRLSGFDYWNNGDELFFSNLEEKAEYVIVLKDSEFYASYQEYFDSMERVYENTYGFIGKVKK